MTDPVPAMDNIAWAVEAELAFHDDNVKATIADLIEDRQHLRHQLALANHAMTKGYTRGWRPKDER